MSFKIVKYKPEFQGAIVDLWKECHLVVPQNDPVEDIRKKLNFQLELFFVAQVGNKVIGSVMAGYDGHRGWLNYLAVLPDYQKRGYGRELVERAIHELRKLGCLKVNLQIRGGNISAVEFYKHLEFKEDDVVSLGKRLK